MLVLTGIELIFLVVVSMGLSFGFGSKSSFNNTDVLAIAEHCLCSRMDFFCLSLHPTSEEAESAQGGEKPG